MVEKAEFFFKPPNYTTVATYLRVNIFWPKLVRENIHVMKFFTKKVMKEMILCKKKKDFVIYFSLNLFFLSKTLFRSNIFINIIQSNSDWTNSGIWINRIVSFRCRRLILSLRSCLLWESLTVIKWQQLLAVRRTPHQNCSISSIYSER